MSSKVSLEYSIFSSGRHFVLRSEILSSLGNRHYGEHSCEII